MFDDKFYLNTHMAKLKNKLQFDGTFTHGVDKSLDPNLDVTSTEVILPKFEHLPLDDYERCEKFPTVPFRMIIIGSSGSGKSTLISKIADQDRETYCQRDYFIWYGKNSPYPDNVHQFSSHDPQGASHCSVAYDDPNPKYFPLIANVFRLGRPKGISPILVVHSWEQIASSPHLRVLINQANIVVFCQESVTDIQTRHSRAFDSFLKCPNVMRKQKIVNSLDGAHDYNWIINGKECKNFYIDYPNTLYNYKKYKIDPMVSRELPAVGVVKCEDSSSSSSSDDGGNLSDTSSSSSSDDEMVHLPMSRKHKAMMCKYKPVQKFDARGVYDRIQDINKKRQVTRDARVELYKSKAKKY